MRLYLQPSAPSSHGIRPTLTLVTQYSVADSVVPTAGVFDVRLLRSTANLGINLQGDTIYFTTEYVNDSLYDTSVFFSGTVLCHALKKC